MCHPYRHSVFYIFIFTLQFFCISLIWRRNTPTYLPTISVCFPGLFGEELFTFLRNRLLIVLWLKAIKPLSKVNYSFLCFSLLWCSVILVISDLHTISRRSFHYYSFLFLSHCITFPVFVLYFFPCIFCNVPRLSPYSFFLLSVFIFFIAYDVSLKTMIRTVQNIHLPKYIIQKSNLNKRIFKFSLI